MGAYLVASDLGRYFPARRIILLAGGDEDSETLGAPAAGTAIELEARIVNAEAVAHGYLQGRFALPISPAPDRLKLAVGELAIYYLFASRPELWGDRNPFQRQYDDHVEWLDGVKESDMFIGSAAVVGATDEAYSTAEDAGGAGLVFGGGGLADF